MSQAGGAAVDIFGTHPDIPTLFVCCFAIGYAIPIANTLEI